jgi:hypothetical protein
MLFPPREALRRAPPPSPFRADGVVGELKFRPDKADEVIANAGDAKNDLVESPMSIRSGGS